MRLFCSVIIFILFLMGCKGDEVFVPKPRMFPKVDYPTRNYVTFSEDYCKLTFDYPDYANIVQDIDFFDEKPTNTCWFDVVFPEFNGRLHCSYYPIDSEYPFDKLLKDAFSFVDKHDIKANYRDEFVIKNKNNVDGLLFEIDGPVASPLQFFMSDSTSHFIRGSLYFNNQVRPDSMAPIHNYVIADVKKIIESLEFN